jgi:hypothetical protein
LSSETGGSPKAFRAIHWLLILPFIGLLFPAFYASSDPVLFGFPFFYWYQFAWVIGSAVLTAIVYKATPQ